LSLARYFAAGTVRRRLTATRRSPSGSRSDHDPGSTLDSEIPRGHPLKALVEEIVVDEITRVLGTWQGRIAVSEGSTRWICHLTRLSDGIVRLLVINPTQFNEVAFRLGVRAAVSRPRDDI
jgi:hypothetical protein